MHFDSPRYRPWMVSLLRVAGVYFITWGLSVVLFPKWWFSLAHLNYPNYIPMWQYVGIVEAVLGLGYFIAASNPLRHWVVILIGFLTKTSLTIGFLYDYREGLLPANIFNMALTNGMIWIIPYGIILYASFKMDYELDETSLDMGMATNKEDFLKEFETQTHENIYDLSCQSPVLLVFLRHFGCTFCREALSELAKSETEIRTTGTDIIIVYQKCYAKAECDLKKYELSHLKQISDPELLLYKYFNLRRGTPMQLFGIKVWWRFLKIGIFNKFGLSTPDKEDPYQMPGVFLLYKGEILKSYLHNSVADTPNYSALAQCADCQ